MYIYTYIFTHVHGLNPMRYAPSKRLTWGVRVWMCVCVYCHVYYKYAGWLVHKHRPQLLRSGNSNFPCKKKNLTTRNGRGWMCASGEQWWIGLMSKIWYLVPPPPPPPPSEPRVYPLPFGLALYTSLRFVPYMTTTQFVRLIQPVF